jgi:hypothetical protein
VDGGTGNPIEGNSIYGHANGLGIRLANGGNDNEPSPVLTWATSDRASTTIIGYVQSSPNTTLRVEFFANPEPSPSGFGEGKQFLGSTTVTTDLRWLCVL